MRLIFPLLCLALCACKKTPASARFVVTGAVTQTSGRCSGVAPSPEDVAAAATPHPLAGARFEVFFGGEAGATPAQSFTTDGDGGFRLELEAGHWCAIEAARWGKPGVPAPANADVACWKREALRCDLAFDVDGGAANTGTVNFARPVCGCHPCVLCQMPPAAAH